MKVLVFMSQFYRLGGAERLQVELASALNARGVRTEILTMYRPDLDGVPAATRALSRADIPAVKFLDLLPHPSVMSAFGAIRRLRRLVVEGGYDAVETSGPTPTILAMLALQGLKVRHVAGVHHVFRRDRDTELHHQLLRWVAGFDRRARYYAVTEVAAGAWKRFSGVGERRVRVVYNSVNDQFFQLRTDRESVRAELGITEGSRVALYVGRLARYKGIDILFDALAPRMVPDNLILVYLGEVDKHVPGSREDLERVQADAARFGLAERVKWLGYRTDVCRFLAAADVLVHPTRTEAFGLVLIEALAAGLPVVASDVEGVAEVMAGAAARLVPPGDPLALRDAVYAVLDMDAAKRRELVQRGMKRAQEFRTARRAEAMLDLFRDTLAGDF